MHSVLSVLPQLQYFDFEDNISQGDVILPHLPFFFLFYFFLYLVSLNGWQVG